MNFDCLKQQLNKLLEDRATPGVDCRVYKDHTEIFRYYSGLNDVENSAPLKGNELYLIFSLTKSSEFGFCGNFSFVRCSIKI